MGGKSTSDSAVLDDKRQEMSSSFDLHSWQGLTEVLRAGKDVLDSGAYAEFRNLILGYAQQGGDVELRKRIDTIIGTFPELLKQKESHVSTPGKEEVGQSSPKIAPKAHPSGIGTRRMQPQFVVRTEVATPVAPAPTPVPLMKEEVSPVPPVAPAPVIPEAVPVPPVAPQVKSEISTPAPIVKEIPVVSVPTPEVAQEGKVFMSAEEYKTRIAEIKRQVHEHIGNPAALMDSHNDLGKKYMTALLSALKATGSGSTEGVDSAMLKLEEAFKALLNEKSQPATSTSPVEEAPVVKDEPLVAEVSEEVIEVPVEVPVVSEPEKVVEPVPEVVEPTPIPEPVIPEPISTPEPAPEPVAINPEPEKVTVEKHSAASTLAAILKREERVVTPISTTSDSRWDDASRNETAGGANAYPQTKHTNKGLGTTNLEALKVETGIDPASIAVRQSELVTPEITTQLNELLHKWSIFSGSGLFGIGPGGLEHPLYMKIATLSMGEVLAGRWEGADPKIVKVVKEYVNAWRHEQGIAHAINETFEHYLRRVVQRIMKRQG